MSPQRGEVLGRRIGLVGCVKRKAAAPSPARDLYTSPLFIGRRRYVEASCDEWWILSAKHGLVGPGEILEPYDTALDDLERVTRDAWALLVVKQINERVHPKRSDIVEFHCGGLYRHPLLMADFIARGCALENPTEGMGIGRQLRFYKGTRA